MPYITQEARKALSLKEIGEFTPGELNYTITTLVDDYLSATEVSYTNINMLMGVLSCVAAELYRRIATPLEDIKMTENGEVYNSLEQVRQLEENLPEPEPPALALDDVKESSDWTEVTGMGDQFRTFVGKVNDMTLTFPWEDEEGTTDEIISLENAIKSLQWEEITTTSALQRTFVSLVTGTEVNFPLEEEGD